MECVQHTFNNTDDIVSFLVKNQNVMFNCITHQDNIKEIILTFPNGNNIRILSYQHKFIYNVV
jgi:hypothetical protein